MNRPTRLGTGGCLAAVAVLLFASVMTTILLAVAIWPGEAKLLAPLLCPDDQPDAFVVADTYSVQPGETTTNFTLYCMGERGQHTEVGYFTPFVLLTAAHAAVYVLLFLVIGARGAAKRRRAGEPDLTPPPPGPAVAATEPGAAPTGDRLGGSDLPPSGPLIS